MEPGEAEGCSQELAALVEHGFPALSALFHAIRRLTLPG